MALFDSCLNIAAAAMQAVCSYAQLHSGAPGAAGTANVTTAGRQAVTWETPSGGDMIATADIAFTGGAASGAVGYVSLWTAATGGACHGWLPITGDATFNAAGEYTLTGISIPGTAS